MAQISKIEWTESTWNPITGCTKISPGCKNCYAERMANRLCLMGQPNYVNGFNVTLHEKSLIIPLKWKKPRVIFVNSMSDLFHEEVPDEFIFNVFDIMNKANWHIFQILTKRSKRLKELSTKLIWGSNIWIGVSVEENKYLFRIEELQKIPASIKFISFEPLLGHIDKLNLDNIDWVIAGGESGPYARPIKESWVTDIRDNCKKYNIPFFFKQWGGINKKKNGRILQGKLWNEMPSKKPASQLILSS